MIPKTLSFPLHARLLLGGLAFLAGCGDASEDGAPAAIVDHVDQSLGRYVGVFTPADEVIDQDGVKTFSFAVPEDPRSEPRGPLCIRGDAFKMSTREGSSDALLIFLQGGGACWEELCSARETAAEFLKGGILDPATPDNPVADMDMVFVPNCDGSIYVGDADRELPASVLGSDVAPGDMAMGYQRGLQNLSASLDVAKREFPNPSRVVIVGASAGGFGSLAATPLVRTFYPGVDIFVFNDSGVGVGTGDPAFLNGLLAGWNAEANIPASCASCTTDGHVTGLIEWNLEADPLLRVSAFSFSQDSIIVGTFLQIDPALFETFLLEETERIANRFPDRFKRMIAAGPQHTAIQFGTLDLEPAFEAIFGQEDTTVNGVRVIDWFGAMINETPEWQNIVDDALQ